MILAIEHQTVYTYDKPVFLEPHVWHLHPRPSPYQQIKSFRLTIQPGPVLLSQHLDPEGNYQTIAHFRELTHSLVIKTFCEVENTLINPFNCIFYPFETAQIPFTYPSQLLDGLREYMDSTPLPEAIASLARSVAEDSGHQTFSFLLNLTTRIQDSFDYEYRELGPPQEPMVTMTSGRGTCRDFTILQIAICRSIGMAARFVSGYYYGEISEGDGERNLHAWMEVYMPGAGWFGFDPTYGIIVANQHIALAASAHAELAAYSSGTFRGDATAVLGNELKINEVFWRSQSQSQSQGG